MRNPQVDKILNAANAENRKFLYEHEAKALCGLYGVPIT